MSSSSSQLSVLLKLFELHFLKFFTNVSYHIVFQTFIIHSAMNESCVCHFDFSGQCLHMVTIGYPLCTIFENKFLKRFIYRHKYICGWIIDVNLSEITVSNVFIYWNIFVLGPSNALSNYPKLINLCCSGVPGQTLSAQYKIAFLLYMKHSYFYFTNFLLLYVKNYTL